MERIEADVLSPASHGFFTRRGGVSAGIYDSLNCGPGSRDDSNAVSENRARVATELDVAQLVSLNQVHSADVVQVTADPGATRPTADAMVTDHPGIGLAVLSADCAPILFEDRAAGVVGAAHSGWRGALQGIGPAVLAAMEGLGADRSRVKAAVGPCISQRAYEVGPEFLEQFLDEDPEFERFFAGGRDDRVMFDLPGFILASLRATGIGAVEWTGHCTYSDPARFFSYRKNTHEGVADYGRLISVIKVGS